MVVSSTGNVCSSRFLNRAVVNIGVMADDGLISG